MLFFAFTRPYVLFLHLSSIYISVDVLCSCCLEGLFFFDPASGTITPPSSYEIQMTTLCYHLYRFQEAY